LRFFQRFTYELTKTFHIACALIAVLTISLHIAWPGEDSIYLILGASLWGVSLIARSIIILYRSFGSKAFIVGYTGDNDVTQIVLHMRRPWKFGPGQYAYLRIPHISATAIFQSHPFFLVWWDQARGEAIFLVSPRRGFTRSLLAHRSGWIDKVTNQTIGHIQRQLKAKAMSVLIEGPYGRSKNLGTYGTVLMVATGIGIAGHLPYIRYLVEAHANRLVVTQKVRLHWEMTRECKSETPRRHQQSTDGTDHRHWVSRWMAELIASDIHHVGFLNRWWKH
jgi:predicted ferric reductase